MAIKVGKGSTIYSTNPKHAMDLLEEKDEAKDTYNTCSYWDK